MFLEYIGIALFTVSSILLIVLFFFYWNTFGFWGDEQMFMPRLYFTIAVLFLIITMGLNLYVGFVYLSLITLVLAVFVPIKTRVCPY